MKQPCVYILKCADDSFYVGSTVQLLQRLTQHESGCVRGYTASRLPVTLVFVQEFPTLAEAGAAEQQLKGWSHAKKQALINQEFEILKELSVCRNESRSEGRPRDTE
jgi:putative endonuclease